MFVTRKTILDDLAEDASEPARPDSEESGVIYPLLLAVLQKYGVDTQPRFLTFVDRESGYREGSISWENDSETGGGEGGAETGSDEESDWEAEHYTETELKGLGILRGQKKVEESLEV